MKKFLALLLLIIFFLPNLSYSLTTTNPIQYYEVINVRADDVLNVRQSYHYRSKKVGEIPSNEKCVAYLNTHNRWMNVHYNGITGWINSHYLIKTNQCEHRVIKKYYDITHVAYDDVLNIRERHHYRSQKMGEIPQDGKCIAYLNESYKNWVMIHYNGITGWVNSHYLRENNSCGPYFGLSTYQSSTLPKILTTYLSFMDTRAGMPLDASIAHLINQAVREGVQLAQHSSMPHLKLNASGHQIDNSDHNVNQFINLFFDFNLTKSQKIEAIIQKMMMPNQVDVILTGQYVEKTGGLIHVRPFMLSKTHRRIVTRNFVFQEKAFMCSYNTLCRKAHLKIRDAVQELLGNL